MTLISEKTASDSVISVSVGSRSDTGKVRAHNEDALIVGNNLWAVADGMGGQAAGEIASSIATRQLLEADITGVNTAQGFMRVMARTNDEILSFGQQHPRSVGLGTTVAGVAALMIGNTPHWLIFHVGDSRVYRFDDRGLALMTEDHSEVAEMVARGRIDAETARTHPNRNVLTRCLGSYPPPTTDVRILPARHPEQFVICSDGLTVEMPDSDIAEVLMTSTGPAESADRLVSLALSRGGHDNVSVIVVASAGQEVDIGEILEDTIPSTHAHTGGPGTWKAYSATPLAGFR